MADMPENFPVDCQIIPGSYMSWLVHDYNGVLIKPTVRPQIGHTCSFYSYCPCIETRSKVKWSEEGVLEEREKYSVDVNLLVSNYDKQGGPNAYLITEMVKEKFNSRVKSIEDEHIYPFLVPLCDNISLVGSKKSWKKSIERAREAIEDYGPIIGIFEVTKDYKTIKEENRIFTGKGPKKYYEDGTVARHAVCLVGILDVIFPDVDKKDEEPAFEYIDSGRMPQGLNSHTNRLLLARSLTRIYIPRVQHVPDDQLRLSSSDCEVQEILS